MDGTGIIRNQGGIVTNPTITLGGISYEIPPLAIKQNRHVEVLAARHMDFFTRVSQNGGNANLLDITESEAEDFTRLVYHAITRTNASLTFEQFENLSFSMKDIMLALPICIKQSGLFWPAAESAPSTGEAIPPSTGMA